MKNRFEVFKKTQTEEDSQKLWKLFKEKQKEDEIVEHEQTLWREMDTAHDTGEYELVGVITHQGRSSESGHYVGWCQHKGGKQFFLLKI